LHGNQLPQSLIANQLRGDKLPQSFLANHLHGDQLPRSLIANHLHDNKLLRSLIANHLHGNKLPKSFLTNHLHGDQLPRSLIANHLHGDKLPRSLIAKHLQGNQLPKSFLANHLHDDKLPRSLIVNHLHGNKLLRSFIADQSHGNKLPKSFLANHLHGGKLRMRLILWSMEKEESRRVTYSSQLHTEKTREKFFTLNGKGDCRRVAKDLPCARFHPRTMQISFHKIKTKNLGVLAQQVIQASKSGTYKLPEEHVLLKKLEDESREYTQAYTKPAYSQKGRSVLAADAARTQAYQRLRAYLKAYGEMPLLADYKDAAELYKVMRRFDIRRMNYAEKSAEMKLLVEELEKPEHAERLKKLKLKPAFDELKALYEGFEDLYAEQASANAALRATPSATAIRRRLERALRDYINLLTAMRSLEGWDMIYGEVNELVKAAAIVYKNDRKKDKVAVTPTDKTEA